MTLLTMAEQLEQALRAATDKVEVKKGAREITLTAFVGRQAFCMRLTELPPDTREPAV